LTSLTPNVTPQWITPNGVSLRVKDTVNVPFPGIYTFKYGVESDGGFVQADSVLVTISTLDKNTVSTPMWVNLAGGYGKSKTWVLDLNPIDGSSKLFNGPVYFAGVKADGTAWEWDAQLSGNSWIMPVGDYGSMTFDLIGDAHFSSNNKMIPALGAATGKFMLYSSTSQISTSGAQLIHASSQGTGQNWFSKMKIVSLTANGLQVIATTDASNWVIYNYVSKDYYDSH